jgi:hypothetical protein
MIKSILYLIVKYGVGIRCRFLEEMSFLERKQPEQIVRGIQILQFLRDERWNL